MITMFREWLDFIRDLRDFILEKRTQKFIALFTKSAKGPANRFWVNNKYILKIKFFLNVVLGFWVVPFALALILIGLFDKSLNWLQTFFLIGLAIYLIAIEELLNVGAEQAYLKLKGIKS